MIKLYDVEVVDAFNELYMVMELCDFDLRTFLQKDVTLTPREIYKLLYSLLCGLNYLHSAGVWHRDLKPANCLLNGSWSIKICDFGLSRATEAAEPFNPADAKRLTSNVVTRYWRAPELICLQKNYTEAIDVWSVGCIFAELLGVQNEMRIQDRGPLFCGDTCFPFSPDERHMFPTRLNNVPSDYDQLNLIFDLLGAPKQADVAAMEQEDAKRYTQSFAAREGMGLDTKFPHAEAAAISLLERMWRLSAKDRIAITDALEHRLFTSSPDVIRDPARERRAPKRLNLEFEEESNLDQKLLRDYFGKVIQASQCRTCPASDADVSGKRFRVVICLVIEFGAVEFGVHEFRAQGVDCILQFSTGVEGQESAQLYMAGFLVAFLFEAPSPPKTLRPK